MSSAKYGKFYLKRSYKSWGFQIHVCWQKYLNVFQALQLASSEYQRVIHITRVIQRVVIRMLVKMWNIPF